MLLLGCSCICCIASCRPAARLCPEDTELVLLGIITPKGCCGLGANIVTGGLGAGSSCVLAIPAVAGGGSSGC
jgi:hypothetical protein